jgi:hypothetical protein
MLAEVDGVRRNNGAIQVIIDGHHVAPAGQIGVSGLHAHDAILAHERRVRDDHTGNR